MGALANLSIDNDSNKIAIIDAGPIPPLGKILKSKFATVPVTHVLSKIAYNNPDVKAGAIPLLVKVLKSGGFCSKVGTVKALSSTLTTTRWTLVRKALS